MNKNRYSSIHDFLNFNKTPSKEEIEQLIADAGVTIGTSSCLFDFLENDILPGRLRYLKTELIRLLRKAAIRTGESLIRWESDTMLECVLKGVSTGESAEGVVLNQIVPSILCRNVQKEPYRSLISRKPGKLERSTNSVYVIHWKTTYYDLLCETIKQESKDPFFTQEQIADILKKYPKAFLESKGNKSSTYFFFREKGKPLMIIVSRSGGLLRWKIVSADSKEIVINPKYPSFLVIPNGRKGLSK